MRSEAHIRRLRLIFEHTAKMVVVTNGERRIEWVNPAFTRITGWTLEEVQGRNPRSFLHGPRTSASAAVRLGASLRRGEPVHDFEIQNHRKSGEPFWVSLSIQPILGEDGEVTEYIAIENDITRRKLAELDDARRRRQLLDAQRRAGLVHLEHELATGRVSCSPEMQQLLDTEPGGLETSYEGLMARVHPEDAAEVRQRYEDAINAGEEFDFTHRMLGRGGAVKWVRARGAVEGWDDGTPATCRLVVQDITAQKEAERHSIERALTACGDRHAIVALDRLSQQLQAPLQAIVDLAGGLEQDSGPQLQAPARGQLERLRRSAERVQALVEDVVQLAQVSSGALALDDQLLELRGLACDAAAQLAPLAAEHGVGLVVEPADLPLPALGDPRRLTQVLRHLLGHAIRTHRPGGRVELRFTRLDDGRPAIAIADDGLGMDAASLARAFEPFYRGAPGEWPAGLDGGGLGLPVARSLMEAMGGSLDASSEPALGSQFVVALRRAPGPSDGPCGVEEAC